jgi:hypothetical protein
MSELTIIGTMHKIFEPQIISPTFTKTEFVVKETRQLPSGTTIENFIKFEAPNKTASILDHYKEGEKVKVYFNVRGREYMSKKTNKLEYFNSLSAWRIEKHQPQAEPPKDSPNFNEIPF